MRPVRQHTLCLTMRPEDTRHGARSANRGAVESKRLWAPYEQFIRKNAGWAAPVLVPMAETLDHCLDYMMDRGIIWDIQRMKMERYVGTYEEILERWYYGQTPKERLKALTAFSISSVYASWGDQAPVLGPENVLSCIRVPGYHDKYFGGHRGADQVLVDLIRDTFELGAMSPMALQTMRLFIDRIIGPQESLAAAKAAVKRLLVRAHPDRYQNIPMPCDDMRRSARRIFDAVTLVRKMVNDPQYGPALYAPRRLERSQGIGWRIGLVVGVVGWCVFFYVGAVLEGARRCLTAVRTWVWPLAASTPSQEPPVSG